MEKVSGFLAPAFIALLIFLLNGILPGRRVTGYINKPGTNEKMQYHLNGMFVFIVILFLWFLTGYFNIIPFDWLYIYRWYGLAGACLLGIIFSLMVVLPYPPLKKSFLADLYFGRIGNLQVWNGRVDAKMWLYLYGATFLGLNALSFMAHHHILYHDQASPGIFLSTILLMYFLIDYLTFEEVHLYTYDLFAENLGFKLGWGCILFYPYFYAIFLWSTVPLPDPHTPAWLLVIYALVFFTGWVLSRGANLQKYFFKKEPGKGVFGNHAGDHLRWKTYPACEWILGPQPPCELPGRNIDGYRHHFMHRVPGADLALALPAVLCGVAVYPANG